MSVENDPSPEESPQKIDPQAVDALFGGEEQGGWVQRILAELRNREFFHVFARGAQERPGHPGPWVNPRNKGHLGKKVWWRSSRG